MPKKLNKYVRDDRSPKPLNETVSRYMSSNRSKNTKPEILLRKALWAAGIRGYRLHWKSVPGKPDIAFPGKRIAIFVNGCFWHRCPHCNLSLPKNNSEFWEAKFRRNVERDAQKLAELKHLNWTVLVIWECELKQDLIEQVNRIETLISSNEEE